MRRFGVAAAGGRDARAWLLALLSATVAQLAFVVPANAAPAVAVSPLNGTPDASPQAQISFLGAPARDISDVFVKGSRSGRHSGRLKAYVSAPGASFLPARGFTPGESVTASALVGPRGHAQPVSTTFTVARPPDRPIAFGKGVYRTRPGLVQSFVSQPQLQPPVVFVTTHTPTATPGDIFLTPTAGWGQAGAMIIDERGQLVWFHPAPKGDDMADFQRESYRGAPVLVWWQGRISGELGVGFGTDEMYSSSYRPIGTISAGNGYQADLHEAQITPRGSAFITAYSLVDADLSSVGGPRDGILQDAILQEIDIPTGLVMFEWHADGHVALADSRTRPDGGRPWDFFHVNSVSLDPWGDGNFIVSSRNTWAAYEINRTSGAVVWRLGGDHPSFHMGAGTGFAWQHDVRWQPDHTLTIFDDGASPKAHSQSRAIRERINWQHHNVELVGRYVHTPPLLTGSQGNDELLADGDSFVGWGEEPYFSEYGPAGETLFDAHIPSPGQSYRAYRFAWSATPAAPPSLAVRSSAAGGVTLYASWNGATGVSGWTALGGSSPSSLSALATVPATGFETAIALPSSDAYFAVQALGAAGRVLRTSASAKL